MPIHISYWHKDRDFYDVSTVAIDYVVITHVVIYMLQLCWLSFSMLQLYWLSHFHMLSVAIAYVVR